MFEAYEQMIDRIASVAEESFWREVADQFPEIKTGDLEPMTSFSFSRHCKQVIAEWLATNQDNIKIEPNEFLKTLDK